MSSNDAVLFTEKLNYSYIKGQAALSALDLSLYEGEQAFLYGDFGSGKSTLFSVLFGFIKGYGGSARLFSKEANAIPKVERSIFAVFDEPLLKMGLSAFENLERLLVYSGEDRAAARDKASAALSAVGLSDKASVKAKSLLKEEQYLLSLASFVARPRRLALLDEPFLSLPQDIRVELLKRFLDVFLQNKTAVLIATADKKLVKAFDLRTVVLYRGEKFFDGDFSKSPYFED